MSGTPFWECVLCGEKFTSLPAWQSHVNNRALGACHAFSPQHPQTLTETDVRRIIREELGTALGVWLSENPDAAKEIAKSREKPR